MNLMIVNLCCSIGMAACGLWLTSSPSMPRLVRIYCALIACGGSVNAIGMVCALLDIHGFVYGDIWPGEAIVNVGASALMIRWTWFSRRRA